jgi:hypothetical protein
LSNGKQIVQRSDGTYTEGVLLLGVGANSGAAVTSDARFSKLVVTQR